MLFLTSTFACIIYGAALSTGVSHIMQWIFWALVVGCDLHFYQTREPKVMCSSKKQELIDNVLVNNIFHLDNDISVSRIWKSKNQFD